MPPGSPSHKTANLFANEIEGFLSDLKNLSCGPRKDGAAPRQVPEQLVAAEDAAAVGVAAPFGPRLDQEADRRRPGRRVPLERRRLVVLASVPLDEERPIRLAPEQHVVVPHEKVVREA